jgi:hypothetical protein
LTERNTTLKKLGFVESNNISDTILSVAAFVGANRNGIRLLHAGSELDLSSEDIDDDQAKRVASELADNMTVPTLILNLKK